MAPSLRWDIFCRVVDNFGDAGVCWRLAKQLASEHGLAVTLWIDDVGSLARIAADVEPDRDDQAAAGIRVRRLTAETAAEVLPDVVIEAFGCGLPDRYLEEMAAAPRPPVWILLEYLSAEPWIDASHALPSRHPSLPLTRWFWFPGFTRKTGGLLREAGLLEARDAFREDLAARERVWRTLGLASIPEGLKVSLFCYASAALPALLAAWADGDEPVTCVVPEGAPGSDAASRGRLRVIVSPFVDQDAFDRRLWECDLNFVRGEDSFVRAQWAGQPFVWHAYPQDEDAHLTKMDAFLMRFESAMPQSLRAPQRTFWYAWNANDPATAATAWPAYRAAMPGLGVMARAWARALARHGDLATGLVRFCENHL